MQKFSARVGTVTSRAVASTGRSAPPIVGCATARGFRPMTHPGPFPSEMLPEGVRSRLIPDVNGMTVHILEAGYEVANRP